MINKSSHSFNAAALILLMSTGFSFDAHGQLAPPQASPNPVLEVDLASKDAWKLTPEISEPAMLPGGKYHNEYAYLSEAKNIAVPAGGWRLNGWPAAINGNNLKMTKATYERSIAVPALPGGGKQVTMLAFEAVNWEATVFAGPDALHLKEVGVHLSPWTPFRVNISKQVPPGQTAVVRVVVRDRDAFKNPDGKFTVPTATTWNDRAARGIIRGVSLQVYPVVYIDDVVVRPKAPQNTFSYDVTLVNSTSQAQTVSMQGVLSAGNPGATWTYPVLPPINAIPLSAGERKTVSLPLTTWTPSNASWWWPNVPYQADYTARLHHLQLSLVSGSQVLQKAKVRFGFCTPGQSGNTYTLNGVHINLRGESLPEGTIATEAFSRLPGFLPPGGDNAGWPGAVRNYQRLNYNVVRFHQVPSTRYMLDVCDELGMMVIQESAIRGSQGETEFTSHPDRFATHVREMVWRDRNRPCVFKWGLWNELPANRTFLDAMYAACMGADGTRPCSTDGGELGGEKNLPEMYARIEHYSQGQHMPKFTPTEKGGVFRADSPYGQGEYIWPSGNTPQGPVWFGLATRIMRGASNSDLRPYTLIDVWPGAIPGMTPANVPADNLYPQSLEQGGKALMDPAAPWVDPKIKVIQQSFAPVAAFDEEWDMANLPSNGKGDYPVSKLTVPAGGTLKRTLRVFNDEFSGEKLEVGMAFGLNPPARKQVQVPLGGNITTEMQVTVPFPGSLTVSVWKNGKLRFQEMIPVTTGAVGK